MNNSLFNPHDKFFKEFFGRKEIAKSFLREYLPQSLHNRFDFSTLAIKKDSYIDKELAEHFSDILYQIKISGKTSYIYFLFEHKSYADSWYSFQILRNRVKIWESFCKQNKKASKLPVIIPVVIYHGEGKWKLRNSIAPLFEEMVGTEKYIPESKCEIFDISHLPDEQIRGEILLRVQLLTLKYIFRPELFDKLPEIFKLLATLSNKSRATEYLEVLLRYMTASIDAQKADDLKKEVQKAIKTGDDIMPTIAEKWVQEGMEKGIEKGMEKGMEKSLESVCRKCFERGMDNEQISAITGLSTNKIEQLRKSTVS